MDSKEARGDEDCKLKYAMSMDFFEEDDTTVEDPNVAEERRLENALKRAREKAEEVAEKDRSERARVKVNRRVIERIDVLNCNF